MRANAPAPFGVYVHWPFCAAICPYCDFNVHVFRNVDMADWARAYERNIAAAAAWLGAEGQNIAAIFFGGGTPSLMSPDLVGRVIAALEAAFGFAPKIEISLEANPSGLTPALLADMRAAGVTRLSLGVQALDDAALRFLGRQHNADEARAAFHAARRVFSACSLDLIYARPEQSLAAWQAELREVAALAPDHASFYQLSFEPETPFYRRLQAGKITPLSEELAGDLYEATADAAADMGLRLYEVSNHARVGHECAHNVNIWRGGDYLGLGPGAHGRITRQGGRVATVAMRAPAQWRAAVEQDTLGWTETLLRAEDLLTEACLVGLRLVEGLSAARLAALNVTPNGAALADLVQQGLVHRPDGGIAVTPQGRLVLDRLTSEIYTALLP